jgi:hypothetical protein
MKLLKRTGCERESATWWSGFWTGTYVMAILWVLFVTVSTATLQAQVTGSNINSRGGCGVFFTAHWNLFAASRPVIGVGYGVRMVPEAGTPTRLPSLFALGPVYLFSKGIGLPSRLCQLHINPVVIVPGDWYYSIQAKIPNDKSLVGVIVGIQGVLNFNGRPDFTGLLSARIGDR